MSGRGRRMGTAILVALALGGSAAGKRPTRAERCAAAKVGAAARRFAGELRCYQRAITAGGVLRAACLAKATQAFTAAFAAAEGRGGCATTGDAAAVGAQADAAVTAVVSALTPITITTATTATTSTTASSTTSTTTATSTTVPVCAPVGSPCGSGTCRADAGGGTACVSGTCADPCSSDSGCMAGWFCVFVPASGTTLCCLSAS
ncbi:MAG TPA: hypothetical protein VKW76_05720 [Candidatus Binatia bacterium]|nr:hypothetical protein [Candidatus Binatia bacterium]